MRIGAVLGSGTVSAEPQKKVEVPRQDHREGSDRYDRLTSRLSPLLYRGIDDASQRWQNTFKPGGVSFFNVVAPIKYVRSSAWVQPKQGNRPVFDSQGEVLAEFPLGRDAGILGHSVETKWIYYRPIFEKSAANPWSTRVVGILVVGASADDADSLFKTAEFQQQLDFIATEVSPYLDAIQVLVGEEKL